MKFNRNLASVHGYLCGDGYVIRNPSYQKHKYYCIGFRNTNKILLKDFQKKFKAVFGIEPYITTDGRCRVQSRNVYETLTNGHSYYSYTWKLPMLSRDNLRYWLRAFFDCEAWVENQPGKSRLIGLDCCNKNGLKSVQNALTRLGIDSQVHKKRNRTIWHLTICGLNKLQLFHKQIGFMHQEKNRKLIRALNSYKDYSWKIPENKQSLLAFIKKKGRVRVSMNETRFYSVMKGNLIKLKKVLSTYRLKAKLFGPWINNWGSNYYCLIIKRDGGEKWNEKKDRRRKRNRLAIIFGKSQPAIKKG